MAARHPKIVTRYGFTGNGTAPGNTVIHEVSLGSSAAGYLLKSIRIFLTGQIVVSAQSVAGTLSGETPLGLISRFFVETVANKAGVPDGKIRNLTPRTALIRRIFDRGFKQPDV